MLGEPETVHIHGADKPVAAPSGSWAWMNKSQLSRVCWPPSRTAFGARTRHCWLVPHLGVSNRRHGVWCGRGGLSVGTPTAVTRVAAAVERSTALQTPRGHNGMLQLSVTPGNVSENLPFRRRNACGLPG